MTQRLSLNDQLRHAFRTGSLPPSQEAEQSFETERRLKEVRVASGIPLTRAGRGPTFYLSAEMGYAARLVHALERSEVLITVGLAKPSLFSLLRPYSIIANPALNVTRLSGLVESVSLPIVSGAQTSGFVAQDAGLPNRRHGVRFAVCYDTRTCLRPSSRFLASFCIRPAWISRRES